jgi:predicted transposase YbfD/YdcC
MDEILTILRHVQDPRDPNARHLLVDVLFLALAGTLCGAKTCVHIADFAEAREDEFREILALPHGVPSHDTFSRVLRVLDPAALEAAFVACMAALRRELGLAPPSGVVAVDGKSLRRAYDKGCAFMPALMVSVWDTQTRFALAQARAGEGGEAGAAVALLKGLALTGCTVTADALHGHAGMATTVRAAQAHYALGLKGNQSKLLAATEAAFATPAAAAPFYETREAGHGRAERRRASVLPAARLADRPAFPGLAALGRIEAERTGPDGRVTTATRYLVLSRPMSPRQLLETVRTHWSIENHLHWTLDVVFDEDGARSRKNHAPENLAILRRLAHNILRAHPSDLPIGRKMQRAAWKQEFFFELFTHMR